MINKTKNELMKRGFTSRQSDVMAWAATGLNNAEVGAKLFVCPRTVKFHWTTIYRTFKSLGIDVKTKPRFLVYVNDIMREAMDGR